MDCEESELASNAKWVHEPSAEVIITIFSILFRVDSSF